MSINIKSEFGKLLRERREALKLSRASLAKRLDVSAKTIQSWEEGRSFNLEMLPVIERELNMNVAGFITKALGLKAKRKNGHEGVAAINVNALAAPEMNLPILDANQWIVVPVVRPQCLVTSQEYFSATDVIGRILVSTDWIPYGGNLVAVRMSDSSLAPAIPKGAIVILNRTHKHAVREVGKYVGMAFKSKGLRIRKLTCGNGAGYFQGSTEDGVSAKALPFSEENGDRLVGRVVGWHVQAGISRAKPRERDKTLTEVSCLQQAFNQAS